METQSPFTARNVAKFAAKVIIQRRATSLTEDAIITHTKFEEDDLVVDLSSNIVGWYVSDKLKPVTDKMIDRVADRIAAKRAKKDDLTVVTQ